MALHIHLDLVGGIAGDMFVAAVLDARPDLEAGLHDAFARLAPPDGFVAELTAHDDGTLTGRRFAVTEPSVAHHHASKFAAIVERLQESQLDPPVRDRAIAIFSELAAAEARVHGVAVDDVSFHEVGAWDSIADIVGAAHLIETLGAAGWSCGPVPKGAGTVKSAHGRLPVPAPATVHLLDGMVMIDDGLDGERVTPTGAAILRHLAPSQEPRRRPLRLGGTGIGFGTRKLADRSNILRLLWFEDADPRTDTTDEVVVIEFEVDDQSPEDLAVGLANLRAAEGVLEVMQWPVAGKKGRLGSHVQLLAWPDQREAVIARCFTETATIGLRWRLNQREVLPRELVTVDGQDGSVRVKIADRPERTRTAKADIDDVVDGPAGFGGRSRARERAERAALEDRGNGSGNGGKT